MDLDIGMRFETYDDLMQALNQYSKDTKSKFWKRDARTIDASRRSGISRMLNPAMIYYEVKFTCIYGGIEFKSKGKSIRARPPSLKTSGCPAYLRFKASEDGRTLQLVAMNVKHNHELKLPAKRRKFAHKQDSVNDFQERRELLLDLEESGNIEIEEEGSVSTEPFEDVDVKIDEDACVEDEYSDMAKLTYRGLVAPVLTPFNDDKERSINLNVIPSYAQYLVDCNITGVLVNGTSGEGMSMSVNERKQVTETWATACSKTKQHLMVQIGGAPLPDVLELAKHAEMIEVDSILCLPELYFKPTTSNDLIRYLQLVAEAAPNTPLLYYHIPMFTNVNINMGQFLNEVVGHVPTFSGIKFTSSALDEGIAAMKANNGKYAVFLGSDTLMLAAYASGFNSAIATTLNVFPELGNNILQSVQEGNMKEALESQNMLSSAVAACVKYGSWVPIFKEAMGLLTPIKVGPVREPLVPLTEQQAKQMHQDLKALRLVN